MFRKTLIILLLLSVPSMAQNQKGNINNFIGCSSYSPPSGNVCTELVALGILASCTEASAANYWNLVGGVGNVGIDTFNTVGIGTTQGNGELEVFGNVGIGTENPAYTLDVSGTVRSSGFTLTASTTTGYVLTATDSTGDSQWQPATGNTYTASDSITLSGTNFTLTNDSASPGASQYYGTNSGSTLGYYNLPSGGSGTNYWSLIGGTGNVGVSTTNTVGIGTTTSGQGQLVVMGGNVGFGTFNPTSLLAVGNQFTVSSSGNLNAGTGSITNSGGDTFSGAFTSSQGMNGGGTVTRNLVFQSTTGNGTTDAITFKLGNNGANSAMVLQDNSGAVNIGIGTTLFNAGLSIMSGKVGIGTWNPVQMLEVNGTVKTTGFQLGTSSTSGYVLTSDSSGNGTWMASNGTTYTASDSINLSGTNFTLVNDSASPSASQYYGTNSGSTLGYYNLPSNYWNYSTANGNIGVNTYSPVGIGTTYGNAGLTVMNGNVGVGTWNPSYNLDIEGSGNIKAAGQITANNYNSTGSTAPANGWTTSAANTVTFYTATTPALTITSGQNIGINSSNANFKLQVAGTADMQGFSLNQNPSSGYTIISNSVGIGTWMATTTQPGSISSLTTTGTSGASTYSGGVLNIPQYSGGTGTNYWQYNSSGNVGVNTTGANGVGIGTSSFNTQGLSVLGNVGVGTWQPTSLFSVGFQTGANSTNGLVIDSNANIGIGTSIVSSPEGKVFLYYNDTNGDGLDIMGVNSSNNNEPLGLIATTISSSIDNGKVIAIDTRDSTHSGYAMGAIYDDGSYCWGSGSADRDTCINRSATNQLSLSSNKGGGAANMIINGNLGIGSASPIDNLVVQAQGTSPVNAFFGPTISSTYATATASDTSLAVKGNSGSELYLIDTNGSNGAVNFLINDPAAAVTSGNPLGCFKFIGAPDGNHATNEGSSAAACAYTDQTFTTSHFGTYMYFQTTPDNSTTKATTLYLSASGNVGIGTTGGAGVALPDKLYINGNLQLNGNLAGGTTGNIGIGTTVTAGGSTCDSSCNTAGMRCVIGLKTVTVGFEPCSVSIIGDCLCLPAT